MKSPDLSALSKTANMFGVGSKLKRDGSSTSTALYVMDVMGAGKGDIPIAAGSPDAALAKMGNNDNNLPLGQMPNLSALFGSPSTSSTAASGSGGGFNPLSLLSFLKFIPGLAEGGDVTPGKAYIVGEKHPEFFVPGASGRVTPTLKTAGDSHVTNLSVNFHNVRDADSFKKNSSQIMTQFGNAAARAASRR
jgi:hypothetical protein